MPDRELFIAKIHPTDYTHDNLIFDGATTKLTLRQTTGEVEVQWGTLQRFQDLLVPINTDSIICLYTEKVDDTHWTLRASISSHASTIQRTITIVPPNVPDAERIIGHAHSQSSTAGFEGRIWDVVLTCPNENLLLADVLALTRPQNIPIRNNLYGLATLGTGDIPTSAFMQNLLAAPLEVRGGTERLAVSLAAFPVNWRDFTELKIEYSLSRDESIDPPYQRRTSIIHFIRQIEVMDLTDSAMATAFVTIGQQLNRFTIHAGANEAGNLIQVIGVTNLSILAHVFIALGDSTGNGVPDTLVAICPDPDLLPYNIISSISIR